MEPGFPRGQPEQGKEEQNTNSIPPELSNVSGSLARVPADRTFGGGVVPPERAEDELRLEGEKEGASVRSLPQVVDRGRRPALHTSNDDNAGPSLGVPGMKYQSTVQQPLGARECAPPPAPHPPAVLPSPLLQPQPTRGHIPAFNATPSVITQVPLSLSEGPPLRLGNEHPCVRLPTIQPGVVARPWFDWATTSGRPMRRNGNTIIQEMRVVLLNTVLDAANLENLMSTAEDLAVYSIQYLTRRVARTCRRLAYQQLAKRFLALNALHSAIQVVGGPKPTWLISITNSIDTTFNFPPPLVPGSRAEHRFQDALARNLKAALDKYKSGTNPTADEVIRLKHGIFCDTLWHPFRNPEWNPFRDDFARARGNAS